MTTFHAESSFAQGDPAEAPSPLAILAREYPERPIDELAAMLDQAARVAAALGEWTERAGDYVLALARDRLDVRRAREIARRRSTAGTG